MKPLEIYAEVILHSGCALPPKGEEKWRKHRLAECRLRNMIIRTAKTHQADLNDAGVAIGFWIQKQDLQQIKDQKGDFLGLLDIFIARVSQ